jgi:hypothetical protein
MAHPSCGIYATDGNLSLSEVKDKVTGFSQETTDGRLDNSLLTEVKTTKRKERGLQFELDYDYPHRIVDRGTERWVRATHSTTVRFIEDIFKGGFVLFDSKNSRSRTVGEISGILDVHPDACDNISLQPELISDILEHDSEGSIVKMWENIDEFTDTAAVQGRVEDSSYSYQFDRDGKATYAMYRSKYAGRTVGVSKSGIVFYGSDDDGIKDGMVDYFIKMVYSRIEG